ncbi:GNAT family N-acetyltransferase [Tissierella sp. MB52-C2]|uniref:GNAT family N-acetyltransferase n=1 Tax=Tissierella sp. MB52-C2 TaxID=3070999 RepID=UPI00280B872C|nr:GNAT family N-acetyltransferase [Tissierella sp. MB52-C2]WMM24565.1 GNAT family N-acetyltransferase [Tissierella sp. MB52-C2]
MENINNSIDKKYKYTSLEYIDEDDIKDAKLIYQDETSILLYKELDGAIELFWAADSKEGFMTGLNSLETLIKKNKISGKKIHIKFIPEEFISCLEKKDFRVIAEFVDFWNRDIEAISIDEYDTSNIRRLKEDEYSVAGQVTRNCMGYSREFTGEDDEWIKEWNEADNSCIFAAEMEGKIVGVCCVNLYGFESDKGTVLWIREVAVDLQYQGKGIGRSLLTYAIKWGKQNGAKRSFLACDVENYSGINLYESLGYVRAEGRGEIRMEKLL